MILFFSYFSIIQAPLGSIPELPAQSCREIKASEGKDTISSKYWLDPTASRTAVLVYCDMDLEGYCRSAFMSLLWCFKYSFDFDAVDVLFI